jgi:hypothetical protein
MYQAQMTIASDDPDPEKQQYNVTIFRWVPVPQGCLNAVFSSPLMVNPSGGGGLPLADLRVPQSTPVSVSLALTNAGSASVTLNPGDLSLSDSTDYTATFNTTALVMAPGATQNFTVNLLGQTTNTDVRTDLLVLASDVGGSSGTSLLGTIDAQILPSSYPFFLQAPGLSLQGGTIELQGRAVSQSVPMQIASLYGFPATISGITIQSTDSRFASATITPALTTPVSLGNTPYGFSLDLGAFTSTATATLTVTTVEWGSFTFPISVQ